MSQTCHYTFLVDSYATEVEKTLSVWAMAADEDLLRRPVPGDRRGRNLLEHMLHQCVSENAWFAGMLAIDVPGPVTPAQETRSDFLRHYAAAAAQRLAALRQQDDAYWQQQVQFFGEPRSRAWVMLRRIAHTAHHRGQQTVLLRLCGRSLHSVYGPTADTGGLPKLGGRVLYAYPELADLLADPEVAARALPPLGQQPVTERAEGL